MNDNLTSFELSKARQLVREDIRQAVETLREAGRKPITRAELIVKIGDAGLDAASYGTRAYGYWRRYEDVTVIARSFVIDLETEPVTSEVCPAIITNGGQVIRLLPGDYITIGLIGRYAIIG